MEQGTLLLLIVWVTIFPEVILGRLAQLVERLPYTQNVGGSSPSAPTKIFHRSLGLLAILDPYA
jgi:hypothetical protein